MLAIVTPIISQFHLCFQSKLPSRLNAYIVVTRILAFLGLFARCLCMAQAISQIRQPEHFSGTTAILRRIDRSLKPLSVEYVGTQN
jgi:hypothetical protein